MKTHIGVGFGSQGFGHGDDLVFSGHACAVLDLVSGQIRQFGVSPALKTTSHTDQICSGHSFAQWVLSRPFDFSFDFHGWRIELGEVLVNKNTIFGLKQDIILVIACQSEAEIYADDLKLAVLRFAEDLGVAELRIRRGSARKVDNV